MTHGPIIKSILISTLCIFVLAPLSFSDEIQIPFAIQKDKFLKECKKHGVDLYDKKKSVGFFENRGSSCKVYTYKTATEEQLEVIKKCAFSTIRK